MNKALTLEQQGLERDRNLLEFSQVVGLRGGAHRDRVLCRCDAARL